MPDFILNIDPSIWNVIKFFALVVVLTPLFELLLHRAIESKASLDVLNGNHIALSESNLGIFSLHSSYWGPSRNKAFLLFITLPILAVDILFEFSFSAATVDISNRRQVWLQPPHHTGYANLSDYVNFTDPSQFPIETAFRCITGPSSLSKSLRPKTISDTAVYISGFEYRMNGTYEIRNSYVTSDNRTVVCSASKTVGHASFVFPQAVEVRGATRGEGVNASGNNTDFDELRALFFRHDYQYTGRLNGGGSSAELYLVGDDAICLEPRDFGMYCGAFLGDTFILANISLYDVDTQLQKFITPVNFTMAVILTASGAPVNGMKNRNRLIRALGALAGTRILSSYRYGDRPSQRLLSKSSLERIAFMIMSVANEEGIGGKRDEVGVRLVKTSVKQSATMKRMAFIPIGIMLFSIITLVIADYVYGILITRKLRAHHGSGNSRSARSQTRVRMSLQWFSERLCDDLRAYGIMQDVSPSDISAKSVVHGNEQCFQVLPLSSRQRQRRENPYSKEPYDERYLDD